MLSYEVDVEKNVESLNREVAYSMHDANRHMQKIPHEQYMDNMYWSRKGNIVLSIFAMND
jgi:hypothetical protein